MRYVGELITECRRDTGNTDFSTVSGIPSDDFLRFLNYGQDRIFALILNTNPQTFQSEKEVSIIGGTAEYSIPDNVYLGERIVAVEYTSTGLAQDYYNLPEQGLMVRFNYPQQNPTSYIRRSGKIIVQPPPSATQGKIRVTYERAIDKLETRRGLVSARTLAGLSLSTLTLDTASVSSVDAAKIAAAEYLCINSRNGSPLAYNIPINGYNSGTGVVTIVGAPFTLQTGEDVPVGAYVTVGRYSTTHSVLKDNCERYIQEYCNLKIYEKDATSGSKSQVLAKRLADMEEDIIQSYQQADKDADEIQITNSTLVVRP